MSFTFTYLEGGASLRNWRKAMQKDFLALARWVLVHSSHLSDLSSTNWWPFGVLVESCKSSA